MILLTIPEPRQPQRIIAFFGMGLIGSALATAIQTLTPAHQEWLPISWTDRSIQKQQLDAFQNCVRASLTRLATSPQVPVGTPSGRCTVIWAAGSSGFAATEAAAREEIDSFQAVLTAAENLAYDFHHVRVAFYLLSSAGGLFEGQRYR